MKKNEMMAFYYDHKTGNNNAKHYTFKASEVIGITMSQDGTTYANLKDFRQARIRLIDYMHLKEGKFGCRENSKDV